ncbi:hypothetical protein Q5H93_09735 [Hymenobacter sp. ASUV-10]|uniref:Uncharacterized protein n=1 Tax=Hymenobacter aranciens TaxID=3063996 RepID=A0ABT9B9S5_9BACT|nr:hypothetical protein [Hymenobacter sp. ASUV-10]MDO7875009.1 hypothetical protein [Hymenobacter sp. ASUV-10]
MADINIQRKKKAPSPWWLVLLAAFAVAVGAYLFIRPNPVDDPALAPLPSVPADSIAPGSPADQARATPPPADGAPSVAEPEAEAAMTPATPDALADQAASNAAAPDYAHRSLQMLATTLINLVDRADLRTPAVLEQRDNLTSATSRLSEPNAPLRAGFVATASLMRAIQQKAYPELEGTANDLVQQANQLSGRNTTAVEQQQNQQFLTTAAKVVRAFSQP